MAELHAWLLAAVAACLPMSWKMVGQTSPEDETQTLSVALVPSAALTWYVSKVGDVTDKDCVRDTAVVEAIKGNKLNL